MVPQSKGISTIVLGLLAALWLLGCPHMGSAAGTWSVISLPQQPGDVSNPSALAADAAGNLYVVDSSNGKGRIHKRDSQGNWTVLATFGDAPAGVAVDTAGNLYVAGG